MSRQNKVNPGMYTQRGRLTQDDAARELRKQREIGSQHTWQPVKKDQLPRFESKKENSDEATETSGDTTGENNTPAADNVQPTKRMMKTKATPKAKAKAAQPKTAKAGARKTAAKAKTSKARTGTAKTGKAKTGQAAKSASKAKSTGPSKRQAVLARNVGGNPKPRTAAKRRKS